LFVSNEINLSNGNFQIQRNALQRSAALYDIANLLAHNQTSVNFTRVFGAQNLEITTGGTVQPDTAENSTESCASIQLEQNQTDEICVTSEN
jgi:hypothetical protein